MSDSNDDLKLIREIVAHGGRKYTAGNVDPQQVSTPGRSRLANPVRYQRERRRIRRLGSRQGSGEVGLISLHQISPRAAR